MSMERENHLQRKIHESDFKCTVCMLKSVNIHKIYLQTILSVYFSVIKHIQHCNTTATTIRF